MSLYDVLQVAIVGGAILVSAIYALGRIAPKLRKRCAAWLTGPARARWLQYVGGKLAGGSGCGDGCNTCGSCGPTARVNEGAPVSGAHKIPVNHL